MQLNSYVYLVEKHSGNATGFFCFVGIFNRFRCCFQMQN